GWLSHAADERARHQRQLPGDPDAELAGGRVELRRLQQLGQDRECRAARVREVQAEPGLAEFWHCGNVGVELPANQAALRAADWPVDADRRFLRQQRSRRTDGE